MTQATSRQESQPTPTGESGGIAPFEAPSGAPDPALAAFLDSLLEIQCALVGAVAGAIYLSGAKGRAPGLVARRITPGSTREDERALGDAGLVSRIERLAAELCRERLELSSGAPHGRVENAPGVGALYATEPAHRLIASPLVAEGVTQGASVLIVSRVRGAPPEDALTRLALTNARFEAFLWRTQALGEAEQKTRLKETLELLDASQQGSDCGSMGALVCHELQRRFGCTRVSIGLVKGHDLRLVAVSGADALDRRSAAGVALEGVMEECADQDAEVIFPPPESGESPAERRVTRAHAEFSAKLGPCAMLSLPLRVEGDLVGALVLERPPGEGFPPGAVSLLRLAGEFLGPALWTRRLADRGVIEVARDRALDLGRAIVGPRHTALKLVGLVLAVALALAGLVPLPASIKAEVEVRAAVARTIVPPFVGHLASVRVRPGDKVTAGQELAEMDARDIDKQLAQARFQREQARVQRDQAQSDGEQGKARVFDAQIKEADATIQLLESQRDRMVIRAPIDGVVGRGELDQLVGARVDPTQGLFEIVGPGRVVVAQVQERDVHRVAVAQTGEFALRATPGRTRTLSVARINPVAEVVRGENVYLVECALGQDAPGDALLPGMSGTARIREGRSTTLLARLLGPVVDEARLRIWW